MPPIRPCNLSTGSCRGGFFAKKQVFSTNIGGKLPYGKPYIFLPCYRFRKAKGVTEIGRQSSGSKHRTAEFGWQTSGDRQSGGRHHIGRHRTADIRSQKSDNRNHIGRQIPAAGVHEGICSPMRHSSKMHVVFRRGARGYVPLRCKTVPTARKATQLTIPASVENRRSTVSFSSG